MKLVTFAKTVLPHRPGERLVVPDDVAEGMAARGEISGSEDWPQRKTASPERPKRPILNLKRPTGTPDRRQAR